MMGVSNPTGDAFLPEIISRKLHQHVPLYVFYILKSWVFEEFVLLYCLLPFLLLAFFILLITIANISGS